MSKHKTLDQDLRELREAKRKLIIEIARVTRIDKVADWMNRKLKNKLK